MILGLLLVPLAGALLAWLVRSDGLRRDLWVVTALVHAALVGWAWIEPPAAAWSGWLALDPAGHLFLTLASALFVAASIYGVGYLRAESEAPRKRDIQTLLIFSNAPEALFIGCLQLFLFSMTLVCVAQHFGILWVAIEATTLASAPLIYFHRHPRSLEATWKYLLVCSVGIALALLGNLFLGVAAAKAGQPRIDLELSVLLRAAPTMHLEWVQAAFVLLLVGYGTKMGLAPLHTWLPDAHSESPSLVSALLSGALLNCALLGILRAVQVCEAAGAGDAARQMLIVLGLGSMAVAAALILGQQDYKRMLAYSSVEHMGIIALGVGLGGAGVFGAMLHAVNHSITKAMLFLVSGNIVAVYRTKEVRSVTGMLRVQPWTGVLWIVGLLAITGTPPFSTFVSELAILAVALGAQQWAIAAIYLVLLAVIFVGMTTAMLRMVQGPIPAGTTKKPEAMAMIVPPIVFAALTLVLGFWLPEPVVEALREVARMFGGE